MKRDFLAAWSNPQGLLKQLRKMTLGAAIAAVGFVSGSAASAAPVDVNSEGSVRPVIVEKSKKAPKLLLKLATHGKTLGSASHRSHSSHSSHSSHRSHSSHYSSR